MDAPVNSNSIQRVKVYRLNEDGQWEDRGTGYVTMDYMERSEELGLNVIDEDDNATLLVHRVSTENIYKQQDDTIISWSDQELTADLALSFLETAGCTYVWNLISSMQQVLHFNALNGETFDNVISELEKLPVVNRSNLPLILKIVTKYGSADEMRLIELMLKDDAFFQKLMAVFEACEIKKDVDGLHIMFNIVKEIISLNSSQILEIILGDQLLMKLIGCLEYNPDVPKSQQHRTFLREDVVFKEVIPFTNPMVLSKIHRTYRIRYLKDVVLKNALDDATSASLDSVINANNAAVVTLLKDDIQELFARLQSPSTSDESRNNLVDFWQEFCLLTKRSQKVSVLRELINDGLFDIIADVLKSPDKKLVSMGAQVLSILVAQDFTLLCSYVVRPENPLLGLLVKGMMEDFGDKCVDIIQNVLGLDGTQVQFTNDQKKMQGNILDIFCEKHLPELADFIMASCPERPGDTVGSHRGAKSEVLLAICELMCSCVQLDPSRTNFLHNNVTEKVLLLTRRKETFLVAVAVRFVRNLLSVHNDNVQNYIVENNTLKPIIDVFAADGHRDNLLSSAVLALLVHIYKNNAVLAEYVVGTFWDQLAPFEHLPSIRDFKTEYEGLIESRRPKSTNNDQSDMIQHGSALDEEKSAEPQNSNVTAARSAMKEAEPHSSNVIAASSGASSTQMKEAEPHSSNVIGASSSSQSKRSGGLVDYEDDEDDEDCREIEQEKRKRPRLSPTSEENKNSSPEQGGEAKEPGEL